MGIVSVVTSHRRKRALVSLPFSLTTALAAVLTATLSGQSASARNAVLQDSEIGAGTQPVDNLQAGEVPVPPSPADSDLPQVEPIISDEEFNSSIPPLAEDDPELGGELESIADFERRFASEQAGAEPLDGVAAPLGLPELADGDRVEEIGDAPIRDAELAAPLAPLESFDVEEVQFAEEAGDEEVLVVKYGTQINGLEEIDELSDANLAATFKGLSALESADGEAANVAMLAARVTEDSALLQRILRAEGWYDAKVTTRIDRSEEASGQPLLAVLDVAAGERFTFAEIIVDAEPTIPADLIAKNLALQVGEPIIAARVQGAEAQIAIALPQEGYPFAEVGQRDILLDQETFDGVYTLPVTTGPRARFGGFASSGNQAFDADHVEVLARFEKGELYDSRKVDDLRQALVATGLLNTVSVVPVRTGDAADQDSEFVTIAVDQDAGPPRTLAGSAGFGTGQGFRVEGSWSHRNLFPPEGALIASAVLGTQEQGAGVNFRRSNAGQRDRTVELGLNALHADYDAFEAFTGRLGGLVSYVSTPIWQKKLTYAYGAEIIGTIEEDFDFDLGERVDRTYFIGALTGQVGFDTSNDLLNPTDGFRLTLLLQPEGSLQDGFSPYARGFLNGSAYYPVSDALVVAGRFRVGSIQGVDREDIAPSRRFYAGGGGSVRGFGYQQLGPQVLEPNPKFDAADPDEKDDEFLIRPIGGLSVNELAAEVRYRFGDFGVVAFVDAGQVYESSTPDFSNLRYGAGIGGRFYTNFGPLRLDVATPIGRRDGESLINIYISIGQAF
ncbi:autotransporter assembly complex protein TamA [Altererythrobacter aquiaggeris]|uniref:autotransporter assembly complex protein TamA n=1 Tax=Aestuarierythrobacter aquiaggeris TaxID=1898396 RepID=UPI003AFB6825